MAGETIGNGGGQSNPQADAWNSFANSVNNSGTLTPEEIDAVLNQTKNVEDAANDAAKDEAGDAANDTAGKEPESADNNASNKESNNAEKSFTQRELERIAKAIGTTTDDEEVLKINLVLRYKAFKQLKDFYEEKDDTEAGTKHATMLQQGTKEDIATAKRELEEAMYLYDPSFKAADEESANLTAEQADKSQQLEDVTNGKMTDLDNREKGRNAADYASYNREKFNRPVNEGEDKDSKDAHAGRSWVKNRIRRTAEYNKKRAALNEDHDRKANAINEEYDRKQNRVADERNSKAEALHFNLYSIVKDVEKNDKAYGTYLRNAEPEQPLKERRNGVKDYYKEANGINNFDINFKLYPHAPEEPEAPEAPVDDNPDNNPGNPPDNNPDNPDDNNPDDPGNNPDDNPDDNPDSTNPDGPDNPDDNNPDDNNPDGNPDNNPEGDLDFTEEDLKKFELEEQRKLEEEIKRKLEEEKALDEEIAKYENNPLIAVNADFTEDRKDLAHDLAEDAVNREAATSGFIKRLWKGTLFKKYFVKQYEREFLDGDRKAEDGGKEYTVDELITKRSDAAIKRFVLSATEGMAYIHEKAGEKRTEADVETTAAVKAAIEEFASAKIPEGGSLKDLKVAFVNKMRELDAEARDDGKNPDSLAIKNYLEVAVEARKRAEHGVAIERVMEGFKIYNATVRDNIRTQAHRDNIDKIVNKLESSKLGQFIPAETFVAAATVASFLTNNVGRAIGGLFVSSAIAGAKERNRVTEDRARMQRDIANGGTFDGQYSDEEIKSMKRRQRRVAKYEKKIGGTLYQMEKASNLTSEIQAAQDALANADPGDAKAVGELRANLIRAVANARVRIDVSDAESKDLISYSSENERGNERLALDMALIRAEKTITSTIDQSAVETMKSVIAKNVVNDVEKTDSKFERTRAGLVAKKAGMTLALGAIISLGSQEAIAAISPTKVGILEKYGILKTENTADASETFLASHFGQLRGQYQKVTAEGSSYTTEPVRVSGDDTAAIEQFNQNGYDSTEVSSAWTETDNTIVEIDASEAAGAGKVEVIDFADNGTKGADLNELRLHDGNGQMISRLHGNSTMRDQVFNYEQLVAENRIHGLVNINGIEMEVMPSVNDAGQLTWGEGGFFTTPSGETIRGFSDSGEKLFQSFRVAADVGTTADGTMQVVSLATEKGLNDVARATITKVTEEVIEHPAVYEFTKVVNIPPEYTTITRDIYTTAIGFAPETARQGLGGVRRAEATPTPNQPERQESASEQLSREEQNVIDRFLSEQESERAGEVQEMMGGEGPIPRLNLTEEESTPAPQEPESESDSTPDVAPEDDSELTRELESSIEAIVRGLDPVIGENGVNFILDKGGYTDSKDDQYMNWWTGLSDDSKEKVKSIFAAIKGSPRGKDLTIGRSLGTWLTAAGIISA